MRPRSVLILSGLIAGTALAVLPILANGRTVGARDYSPPQPFAVQAVADFDTPWAIAALPDGRMLVTEHAGHLFVVTPEGEKTEISGVPEVHQQGQLGMHDVAPAPDFAQSGLIYLTYAAPGEDGSQIVLARARLDGASLSDVEELWRQPQGGGGGHPGAIIAFDPAGEHLFLTLGERTLSESAQDPAQARGKVLRLMLDGSTPADNPFADEVGVAAQLWTLGNRNPYGLAFAPDGALWLHEMGPRGGDELNLIAPGLNYGWPVVSNGSNYSGSAIPDHDERPEFEAPRLSWTPVIAPAGMVFYTGDLFPDWQGSALIGGLAARGLVRVTVDGDQADEAERWDMDARIRDVAMAPDGAVWLIEDDAPGQLLRLTPRD